MGRPKGTKPERIRINFLPNAEDQPIIKRIKAFNGCDDPGALRFALRRAAEYLDSQGKIK